MSLLESNLENQFKGVNPKKEQLKSSLAESGTLFSYSIFEPKRNLLIILQTA